MAISQDNKAVIPLHKPPLNEKLFFFISGILTSVPLTLFIDQFTNSLLDALPMVYAILLSTIVLAPFIEEFAKVFPLFYRHGETQRSFLTLGFLVGLGFGIVEFLTYILALEAPILTRLPAIFMHPMNTSITAYGIATKRTVWFYLLAVALHFSFNFAAVFYPLLPNMGIIAVLLLAFYLSWRFYYKTSEKFVD
jgi:RsiW-degrading membrane proteinase PrsW (M82 family)